MILCRCLDCRQFPIVVTVAIHGAYRERARYLDIGLGMDIPVVGVIFLHRVGVPYPADGSVPTHLTSPSHGTELH